MFYYLDGRVDCNQYTDRPTHCGGRRVNALLALNIIEGTGTPPVAAAEPVTLQEAKDHLHVSYTDDDSWITAEIKAARQSLEKFTGLSLVAKTIEWWGANPRGYSELPYGPVLSIVSFKDSEDNVIDAADYQYSGILGDFLTIVSPTYDMLKIAYTAGYTTTNIPAELKEEIKRMVAFSYEHRGDNGNDYSFSNKARSYRRVPVIL